MSLVKKKKKKRKPFIKTDIGGWVVPCAFCRTPQLEKFRILKPRRVSSTKQSEKISSLHLPTMFNDLFVAVCIHSSHATCQPTRPQPSNISLPSRFPGRGSSVPGKVWCSPLQSELCWLPFYESFCLLLKQLTLGKLLSASRNFPFILLVCSREEWHEGENTIWNVFVYPIF